MNESFLPVLQAALPGKPRQEECGDWIWSSNSIDVGSSIFEANRELGRFELAIEVPNIVDSSQCGLNIINATLQENPISGPLGVKSVKKGKEATSLPSLSSNIFYELSAERGLIVQIDWLLGTFRNAPREIRSRIVPLVNLLEGYNKEGSLPEGAPQAIKECILNMREDFSHLESLDFLDLIRRCGVHIDEKLSNVDQKEALFKEVAELFEKAFQQKFDIQQKILGKRLEPAEEKRE